MAFAGDLTFNPVSDTLIGSDGKPPFKFSNPSELPPGTLSLGDTYVTTPGLTRLLSTPALEKLVGTLFMIMGIRRTVLPIWLLRSGAHAKLLQCETNSCCMLLDGQNRITSCILWEVDFRSSRSTRRVQYHPLVRAAAMHRLMCTRHIPASTSYIYASPYLTAGNSLENSTTSGLAEGPTKAYDAYGVRGARILCVVHPTNATFLVSTGWNTSYPKNRHGIHFIHPMLTNLAVSVSLDPSCLYHLSNWRHVHTSHALHQLSMFLSCKRWVMGSDYEDECIDLEDDLDVFAQMVDTLWYIFSYAKPRPEPEPGLTEPEPCLTARPASSLSHSPMKPSRSPGF
ncbi:hypothetical protein M405DRAFT_922455 [Rhizopogon salebrosus TDB-379]|nr:hypothetical protein M405DRAFT_922455 [Rhizopogon salebrosus TDB-379]